MYYPFYFDKTILILIPAILVTIYAQGKISSTYNKYRRIGIRNGYTGALVARMILDNSGLSYVKIEMINKELGDHYDPRDKVLRLSPDVYNGNTIAAAGIAAHEVGHAIQDSKSYGPLVLRNTIVPIVNLGSNLSWILLIIGLVLGNSLFINLGIIFFSGAVIFQLVTLPVEFNASNRALKILSSMNILYSDELDGAKKVLKSAALTYIAAALMAISQLIRLIAISKRE